MQLSQQLKGSGRFLPGVVPNLIKNQYQGSTMAFRKEILEAVLPFPNDIPMHDSWIGLVNAVIGRTVYLPDRLVFYRRHESNVTVGRHGTVESMFAQRWALTKNLICRMGTLVRVRRKLRQRRDQLLRLALHRSSKLSVKKQPLGAEPWPSRRFSVLMPPRAGRGLLGRFWRR